MSYCKFWICLVAVNTKFTNVNFVFTVTWYLKFTTFIQSFINLGQSHCTFNWFFFSKCNDIVNIKTLWNKFCAESSRNWEDPQIWYSLARWYIDKRTRDFWLSWIAILCVKCVDIETHSTSTHFKICALKGLKFNALWKSFQVVLILTPI